MRAFARGASSQATTQSPNETLNPITIALPITMVGELIVGLLREVNTLKRPAFALLFVMGGCCSLPRRHDPNELVNVQFVGSHQTA